jgi:hypothetical protein
VTQRPLALGSLLLGLAVLLAAAPAPSVAASSLATMTVTTRDAPSDPQLLSTSFGRNTFVTVNADGATDVTVTFSGTGLTIDTPVVNLGAVNGSRTTSVEVTATSGGFHTLNVQVTSTNSAPVGTSLPLMWAPGGPPLPATGDLTGRNYGNVDLYSFAGTSYEDRQLLTFLDEDTAYIGLPAKGRPSCPTASETKRTKCVAYRYDESTGLVSIGGAIGKVAAKSIYTNGIGRADDQDAEETFNSRTFTQRVGYPSPGKRYGGTWKWTYDNYPDGLTFARITLRKNGTFELAWAYDNEKAKSRKGSYIVYAPGQLRLQGAFGVEFHTLAVRAKPNGTADPSLGIWLTFGKGKSVTGALLKPVKP